MKENVLHTVSGDIHYWVNEYVSNRSTLIFLPGLTADHRLFERQIEYFQDKCSVLVWDAPGHNASRPFRQDYSLDDKSKWLHEIIIAEQILRPVLIGQSMGGYVAQSYIQQYPNEIAGFIAIDSAPLNRRYTTAFEIWSLRNCEPVYRAIPWKWLVKSGAYGCATTEYGRGVMRKMMLTYTKDEYCSLAGHGYRILAEAFADDKTYQITCPALLICGEKDRAAAAARYNRAWAKGENLPIQWIAGAGHNSNTDCPDEINRLIETFVKSLEVTQTC